MRYNQREIILVPFPYSDLSATKRRPVLIVSNNKYNNTFDDVVVCVITSNRYQDDYSVPLENEHLEIGVLPERSVVKIHKLFTIEKTQILRKFSVIDTEHYSLIEAKIIELVTNSDTI